MQHSQATIFFQITPIAEAWDTHKGFKSREVNNKRYFLTKQCKAITRYLTEYFGITEIHSFKALNTSQTIEKFDWMVGKAIRFNKTKA